MEIDHGVQAILVTWVEFSFGPPLGPEERWAIVEYLKSGWTRPQLLGLFAAAGLTPHEALRTARSPAADFGLLDPEVDEETLLAAMTEHPELVNRPIVCTPKGVRLCRPAERVLDLLERTPGQA